MTFHKIDLITKSAYIQQFKDTVLDLPEEAGAFESRALELFRWQAAHLPVYRRYLELLGHRPKEIRSLQQIPFLPIQFFKSQPVRPYAKAAPRVFTSSGTSGAQTSRHEVYDLDFYHRVTQRGYERLYGPLKDQVVLALLPSYLERQGSSLVEMARHFISRSQQPESGFYLDQYPDLANLLARLQEQRRPVLLLGVTFALLELAERFPQKLDRAVIMETGGMKGRRRELVRQEVHAILQQGLGGSQIHSEYGMTELFSQAYSQEQGYFHTPPWMQVLVRRTDDPFSIAREAKTGGINVVDLANVESCAFVQTDDLGRRHASGSFEVLGRFDQSDVRGCNLMVVS